MGLELFKNVTESTEIVNALKLSLSYLQWAFFCFLFLDKESYYSLDWPGFTAQPALALSFWKSARPTSGVLRFWHKPGSWHTVLTRDRAAFRSIIPHAVFQGRCSAASVVKVGKLRGNNQRGGYVLDSKIWESAECSAAP